MIYTKLTKKAMEIAEKGYYKQVDKYGIPYIFRVFDIAEKMDDEVTTCVALLYELLNKTNIKLNKLAQDFSSDIINAIEVLNKDDRDLHSEYIEKIKNNTLARKVKLEELLYDIDKMRNENQMLYDDELMETYLMSYTVLKKE